MRNYRTIRYRLLPETGQNVRALVGLAGACRYVWNYFLGANREQYNLYRLAKTLGIDGVEKPPVTFFSLGKAFIKLRNSPGHEWLKGYHCATVRYTLKRQADAWKEAFKDGGPPKFHGKGKYAPSFTIPENVSISGNHITIPRIGRMRIKGSNPYPTATPIQAVVKREMFSRWYVYVAYDVPDHELIDIPVAETAVVGVDRGIAKAVTCSTGLAASLPKLDKLIARRKRYQRRMARQVKGSNRRAGTKSRIAKLHRKEKAVRQNWAHHAAKVIASLGQLVAIEKLNTKRMTKSAKGTKAEPGKNVKAKSGLNREILKSSWGKLEQYLSYKAKELIQINPAYTSQTCSQCGCIAKDNRPSQSRFECTDCGYSIDADLNAAINIAVSGLAEARGQGATAQGGAFSIEAPTICEQDMLLAFVQLRI